MEELVNPTLQTISWWMAENGLQIAPAKSEAILLARKPKYHTPVIHIDGQRIRVKKNNTIPGNRT